MNKSFEENLEELESIVKELESGNVNLDDAINKYSEAMKLVKVCEDKIKNAEEMVTKIVKENGSLEDFEVTE
jgi:exodeoxyribonuclease VII small subunit